MIGVNNQFRQQNIDAYQQDFRELLDQAIMLGGNNKNNVFVLSIPDSSVTPSCRNFGSGNTSQEIDAFNIANKGLSTQLGVQYFDITPISRTALGQFELVASDGLHFSGKMYSLWVDFIQADILARLVEQ